MALSWEGRHGIRGTRGPGWEWEDDENWWGGGENLGKGGTTVGLSSTKTDRAKGTGPG